MVQCIAEVDPTHFTDCVSKLNNLMNSYQNRPPIGLSLFWAIGQGGLKNFDVGIQGTVLYKSILSRVKIFYEIGCTTEPNTRKSVFDMLYYICIQLSYLQYIFTYLEKCIFFITLIEIVLYQLPIIVNIIFYIYYSVHM